MKYLRAFSLVELSIVLVNLGLLVGGVLGGQSLIRAAEMRSVGVDLDPFSTATHNFRDKYFGLPGDITNAKSFWGQRAAGSNLVCQQTIGVYTGTCNSDGDGYVDKITGDTLNSERFLFWQHLAYAGLVEGSFTGASDNATSYTPKPSTNAPTARFSGTYYDAYVPSNTADLGQAITGSAQYFDGTMALNTIGLRGGTGNPPLKPEEAWNIDMKFDDGKPATGPIFAFKASNVFDPGCTTSDIVTATYAITNTNKLCYIDRRMK